MTPPPEPLYAFRGSECPVYSLCFSPDALFLFSGDMMGRIKRYDLRTKRGEVIASHSDTVLALAYMDPHFLASQGRDDRLHIWDLREKGKASPSKTLPVNSLTFCRFTLLSPSPSEGNSSTASLGAMVACLGSDDRIKILDVTTESYLPFQLDLPGKSQGMVMCLKLSAFVEQAQGPPTAALETPQGQSLREGGVALLCAGFESGAVAFWRLERAAPGGPAASLLALVKILDNAVMTIDVCHGRGLVLCAGADTKVGAIQLSDFQERRTGIALGKAGISELAVRGDGKIMATAGWDSKIRVFQMKNFKPLGVLSFHREGIQGLSFAGTSNLMAAASKDTRVSLWALF